MVCIKNGLWYVKNSTDRLTWSNIFIWNANNNFSLFTKLENI